jgi:hypothetical protein
MAIQRHDDPVPEWLPEEHADEYRELRHDDRLALTPQALRRWTADLTPDDYTLGQIVALERKRSQNLRTLRAGAELTDQEYRLLRYLQRHDGQTRSYVQIAHHLWGSPNRPITAATFRQHGYASGMIATIQGLVYQLRHKLEIDALRPQHLANVRGVGYVWYAEPPSIDDGVNYDRRATEHSEQRRRMLAELGLIEGEFVATRPLDREGAEIETRYLVEPEYEQIVRSRPRAMPGRTESGEPADDE